MQAPLRGIKHGFETNKKGLLINDIIEAVSFIAKM
jgi:hypothetical protein